jgi:hypothetical protein
MQVSFGDNVRFRSTPVTEQLGLAGQLGTINGESVPSSSGVVVEGPCPADLAVNVVVEGRSGSIWIAPDHIEFVDHGAGQEMTIGKKRFIRSASGQWIEQ